MRRQYKARQTFTGVISMDEGQVKKLEADSLHVKDLLKAKLIEEVKTSRPKAKKKK